ncbi:MAG: hypothetical protein CFE23_08330 [Flavobacterium sp. BFFFF1]|uniref:sensor histidine kinase n=1 Tax=Flavobacterium sp. BFFFF1 TaxID=2015557 RepID=UPI000BDC0740|nr:sensor histidine kinase [Flavobacterium sp. BFFFF1]OYU80716.1 MAG: hypothetical protein CFE23_08330 [Flavobacterium sp. BFFFF1]
MLTLKNKAGSYFALHPTRAKILLHILVWLMFFSIPFYVVTITGNDLKNFFSILAINVVLFYFNFLYVVPKYFMKKRWKMYSAAFLVIFSVYIYLFVFVISMPPPGFKEFDQLPLKFREALGDNPKFNFFPGFIFFTLMISVSSFLKFVEVWNENSKKNREIENANRTIELNFLKSQLKPHFFFNSLNTIYSLSIAKSEKTSEAILNLSELMRYIVMDKKDSSINRKVKLEDELNYISNYIELQKLRFTNNNFVAFLTSGKVDDVEIYPLLFISFIENAFKYGVHPTDQSIISITFSIEQKKLKFEVTNDIHFQQNSYDSFELGNENSIRRLNLYYPNNRLEITSKDKYTVSILIDLDEN